VASDAGAPPTTFRNVLVAVDLSPASKDVLSAAVALTSNEAEQLTVMHAVKGLEEAEAVRSPARWTVPEYRTHILEEARRSLGAVVATVPASADTRVEVTTGSAARAIRDHAADVNADLVVVGRSTGFKVLGSTAVRVLRKNDRSLLIIPSGGQRTQRVARQLAA
jgi:nucleotide-binding universal stress UspA family protein